MRNSLYLAAFYRAMANHVSFILSFQFNRLALSRAMRRLRMPGHNIDWGGYDNNFIFAFCHLMGIFHAEKPNIDTRFGLTEKVDFIFDVQGEKKEIILGWEKFVETSPTELRERFGAFPRFEDDSEFLPLQAADLVAGHGRLFFELGLKIEESELLRKCKGHWVQWAVIEMNEQQIVRRLFDVAKYQSGGMDILVLDEPL